MYAHTYVYVQAVRVCRRKRIEKTNNPSLSIKGCFCDNEVLFSTKTYTHMRMHIHPNTHQCTTHMQAEHDVSFRTGKLVSLVLNLARSSEKLANDLLSLPIITAIQMVCLSVSLV